MEEKTMYDLKLNESMRITDYGQIYITRVPGGWIYDGHTACFVPYNSEFKTWPEPSLIDRTMPHRPLID